MVINLTSDEPCYATNHYIGEILGIHPTRVSVHLNNLKKMGYLDIKIVRNKDKHITKRLITPTPALRNRIGGLSETANQPISETAKGIIKKDNKEDNKHISKSNGLIKDREKEDFKKFWFTIPELRRINKPLTLKHWKEATHKESVETIQNAMELFVQRVEPQFIKTSYNWLKQEYWKSIPPAQEKVRKGFEYV